MLNLYQDYYSYKNTSYTLQLQKSKPKCSCEAQSETDKNSLQNYAKVLAVLIKQYDK